MYQIFHPEGGEVDTTLADSIRRAVADEILAGRFDVGARLEETELAERFSVSRTPVREALRQLASAGLVSIRPRRGAVVEEIDSIRVGQAFEAAAEMEAIAAGWAASRGALVDRGRLLTANDRCRKAVNDDNPTAFAAANREFHDLIAQLASNDVLSNAVRFVRIQTAPFQRMHLSSQQERQVSYEEHQDIADAIVHGRSAEASAAMRAHIFRSGLAVLAFVGGDRETGMG